MRPPCHDIAIESWQSYRQEQGEAALRAEVQALAGASAEQVHAEVQAVVKAIANNQPTEVQQKLAGYLDQIPASIRRSLRRPSDPTGTTVPAGLSLHRGEDLLRLLPSKPPRFRPGQKPLPGQAWELEELLGVGGFGEVWKARHAVLKSKKPVAPQVLPRPGCRQSATQRDRLARPVAAAGPSPGDCQFAGNLPRQ